MSEAYLTALQQEIAAWQDVEAVVRDQRAAIVRRQGEAVWDSQETLREGLRLALLAHERTRGCRPATELTQAADFERQAQQAQRQVRDAVRLNHELLKDICSYLDMIREALLPQPLPAAYGPARLSRADFGATSSRVA